ncbi:polysaccharide deacetylase family protein [Ensifer canadensis]
MLTETNFAADRLAPLWPPGKQSAVALAFDVDGPTGDAMLDGSLLLNPRYFSQGAYGPWKALPRLLDLLSAYELKATFFIPTWVVLHWGAHCERIVREGHEVAYHGHRHEVFIDLTREQQLAIMERSRAIFQERLGVTPIGFRTPLRRLERRDCGSAARLRCSVFELDARRRPSLFPSRRSSETGSRRNSRSLGHR